MLIQLEKMPLRKRLTLTHSSAPKLYGLPKIHKETIPLRPIVSTIGSPNYNLGKELDRILAPLVGNTSTHVKNSTHFVHIAHNSVIHDNDLLVSFDVSNLFILSTRPCR